jgi:hypothetical protein
VDLACSGSAARREPTAGRRRKGMRGRMRAIAGDSDLLSAFRWWDPCLGAHRMHVCVRNVLDSASDCCHGPTNPKKDLSFLFPSAKKSCKFKIYGNPTVCPGDFYLSHMRAGAHQSQKQLATINAHAAPHVPWFTCNTDIQTKIFYITNQLCKLNSDCTIIFFTMSL